MQSRNEENLNQGVVTMALEKLTKIGNKTIVEIAEEILEIVRNEESLYDAFGIRWDSTKYNVGDNLPNSHQLFQDQEYDENDEPIYPEGEGYYEGCFDAGELNGTCSIGIDFYDSLEKIVKKIEESNLYNFNADSKFYLIQGYSAEGGNDIDESIITEAKVRVVF